MGKIKTIGMEGRNGMKKTLALFLAFLMSVSVLFSFGACTKNKTSSEQFQDAAASTVQFFSDYLKSGNLLPDYSEKAGVEANFALQLDQLESDGENLLEGVDEIFTDRRFVIGVVDQFHVFPLRIVIRHAFKREKNLAAASDKMLFHFGGNAHGDSILRPLVGLSEPS